MLISTALLLAAGCDTVEQDADGQMLSINNDPVYFLPGGDGFIDLGERIISPGKVSVEITGTTKNGSLKDLGKGLLQYSPSKGSTKDSFRFRVFSDNNNILGEDSIGIIIPGDTTTMPCAVYTRPDSALNVTGTVTIDVAANDYACFTDLTISVNVVSQHGSASVVNNKIVYTPNSSFEGRDQLLYKAVSSDPSMVPGYNMVWIFGPDSLSNCHSIANNDIFYKPFGDTTLVYLDVLANDEVCNDSSIMVTRTAHYGNGFADNTLKKIGYRNSVNPNHDDTLFYQVGSSNQARVIIKRQ
jgi:hypothetical protein